MTGMKSFYDIETYKKNLEKCFQQKVEHIRIDNTFFSRKQKKNIDLSRVYHYLKNNKFFM